MRDMGLRCGSFLVSFVASKVKALGRIPRFDNSGWQPIDVGSSPTRLFFSRNEIFIDACKQGCHFGLLGAKFLKFGLLKIGLAP